MALYCVTSAIILLYRSGVRNDEIINRDYTEWLLFAAVSFWLLLVMVSVLLSKAGLSSTYAIGVICVVNTIVYYSAPLSTLFHVLKTRNPSSM